MGSLDANFGEQLLEIMACQLSHGLRCRPAQLAQQLGHIRHIRRVIDLAAVRDRCQIGAVGFNEQPVIGHKFGHVTQVGRRFEGQDAGKGDVKTQVQCGSGYLLAFGEAMKNPARTPCSPGFALFFQDGDGVV